MNVQPRLPPLLHGLFRELVANGVPIGIRDYLDGIRALRLGYGQCGAALPGGVVRALQRAINCVPWPGPCGPAPTKSIA